MLNRLELARRIGLTVVQLSHSHALPLPARGSTQERLRQARKDLTEVNHPRTITKAWQHLSDHGPGYPATSMGGPSGKGGHSDRTGELATPDPHGQQDQVSLQLTELDDRTSRLVAQTLGMYSSGPHTLSKSIEEDARQVRWIVLRWAQEPHVRYCTSCKNDHGYLRTLPGQGGRYVDVCAWCGDYRRVNKALPPPEVLHYHHLGQGRIPEQVLRKYRHRLPRGRR